MELRKVLYVDDEPINLELLKITFLHEFNIITATSAADGLSVLEKDPGIQVIISDLKMPFMNGLDFIKEIKKNDKHKVCMLLTGYMETEVMLEGFNKDLIFRYIIKPWDREDVRKIIQEAFRRL